MSFHSPILPTATATLAEAAAGAPGAPSHGTPTHPEPGAAASPPLAHPNQFTPARQVVFLDALASSGNVRVSAARAGVSHETVYRQRRRCARFAALWEGALHHARPLVAAVVGDRALDGVLEEVWFRGELVGQRRRYDSRLLLAHMARLDAFAAQSRKGPPQAEWFEAELARLAGHPEPEGFDEAQGLWDRDKRGYVAPDAPPPPTLREFSAWYTARAIEGVSPEDEELAWEDAADDAEALYEEWEEGARAVVDAILQGDAAEPDPAPAADDAVEYKSADLGGAPAARPWTLSHLSTPPAARGSRRPPAPRAKVGVHRSGSGSYD